MIATSGTAKRIVLSFAQQISLSVLGTLAATALLATVQRDWAPRPAAPVAAADQPTIQRLPSLTAGGKFAARAVDGDAPEPFVILTSLPPILPLFTASTVPGLDLGQPDPILGHEPAPALEIAALPEPAQSGRPTPHREARHVAAAIPARRAETHIIAMAALPDLPRMAPEEHSLWSRSKTAYQKVAGWSGEIVDSLLP